MPADATTIARAERASRDAGRPSRCGELRLAGVSKSYGDTRVVKDLDLTVTGGEFVTLLGPSGSGKSTTLMMIAGFEDPSAGTIVLDERDITCLPPHKRDMGMMFQSYALFPHLTVAQNVGFPLQMRGLDRREARRQVDAALDRVQLLELAMRLPRELSGGQQQRVALARATVYQPPVLLMDEPLSALDRSLRRDLQVEIRRFHRELDTTIVYVTHDQDEAMVLSDRVAIMREGQIEQIGTPREVYDHPRTTFAASFLGETNLMPGTVVGHADGYASVRLDGGDTLRGRAAPGVTPGAVAVLTVRPQAMRIAPPRQADHPAGLRVVVEDVVYLGSSVRVDVRQGDRALRVETVRAVDLRPGDEALLSWDAGDATVIAETA